jgi:hypothetical protein
VPPRVPGAARRGRRRARAVLAPLAALVASLFVAPAVTWGTVEEQRARLPPPADCTDPVEGRWMGLLYVKTRTEWYEMTLDVHRADAGSDDLHGEILAHWWAGREKDKVPPACTPAHHEFVVHQPATGGIHGQHVDFGAKTIERFDPICGETGGYSPDSFSGVIDPKLQEFQSVFNELGEPLVFRRIKCDGGRPPPAPGLVPPGFGPAKRGGCGK